MLQILVWSVFVGSLGMEAAIAGGWLRWRQVISLAKQQEEEEILTDHQNNRKLTTVQTPPASLRSTGETESKASATGNSDRQLTHFAAVPPHLKPAPAEPSGNSQLVEFEYKIVRANFDLFRDPQVLQRLCEEEQQAGWTLLEKLDDRRVRFKRPIAWRKMLNSEALKFDPYRCHYGPTTSWLNLFGAIAAVTTMVLPAYLGYVLVANTLETKNPARMPPATPTAPVFEPSSPEPPPIP
jgi:hypothetical protein